MLVSKVSDEGVTFASPEDEIDLWHYSSKYYDPVKAREYYLRTRELKGRKSAPTKQLSKEERKQQAKTREKQSQATAYVRDQISKQQTEAQKKAAEKNAARLEKVRLRAEQAKQNIRDSLEALAKKLSADVEAVPKPKLNEIPANASPQQRAFLERQNAKLNKDYNRRVRAQAVNSRNEMAKARGKARDQLTKVGTELKSAVGKARKDYAEKREAISVKYRKDLNKELKNIDKKVR